MPENAERAAYEQFERYLKEENHREAFNALQEGKRVILGFRNPSSSRANAGLGLYDDRFVVMWSDGSVGSAQEFIGNTDPSAYYEDSGDGRASLTGNAAMGADADGDGRLDLGRIPAGVHLYRKGTSKKFGDRVLRSVNAILAERDINHDGAFAEQEATSVTDQAAMLVRDFLFHPGLPDRTGSAGCQTMLPEIYELFWAALGDQEEILYVLIEVDNPAGHPF
jgi:hypothetical protein